MCGQTVYTNSTVERREYRPINVGKPLIVYFGSIRLGRNNALIEIADALRGINSAYKLEVYSGENDPSYYEALKAHPSVVYGGSIPYSEVQKKTADCDIFVIAEGFREEDLNFTRYSLSTKAADSLASGAAILMYGPEEAGVVGYMKETGAALVCSDQSKLKDDLEQLIQNQALQKEMYDRAIEVSRNNHLVENTAAQFTSIIEEAINEKA
jgi:glycosyltransferase involved in cell wall biosynthesis